MGQSRGFVERVVWEEKKLGSENLNVRRSRTTLVEIKISGKCRHEIFSRE